MANAGPAMPAIPPINIPIRITRDGRKFSVIYYNGNVYRADTMPYSKGNMFNNVNSSNNYVPTETITASEIYSRTPIKYFALDKEIVERMYAKKGAPYIYTWQTSSSLVLLNMTDPETYTNVLALVSDESKENAIKTAFRKTNAGIKRYSSSETQSKNDSALKTICELGSFDGYYTPDNTGFHAEIGLCASAFHKLRMVQVNKHGHVMPTMSGWAVGRNPNASGPKKTRSRFQVSNNNNNTTSLYNFSKKRKRKQSRKTRRR